MAGNESQDFAMGFTCRDCCFWDTVVRLQSARLNRPDLEFGFVARTLDCMGLIPQCSGLQMKRKFLCSSEPVGSIDAPCGD